jgi:DNA-binding transcriptional regulator YiaG
MSNIAKVLKAEICRLAKREIKAESASTKRAIVQYRRDIARLKRDLAAQAKEIAALKKRRTNAVESPAENESDNIRFSARSVKAQRVRLGLSALDYGKLVGVSQLTIYAWEQGKSRPRKAQLAALVAIRGIGKREAMQKLAELK